MRTIKSPVGVNGAGLEEIRAFLLENHKRPELYTGDGESTMNMLRAWARDAEFQLCEGNTPRIEIRSFNSASGVTVEYTISDAGIDQVEIEVED
jgi:hypothetical protein